MPDAFARVDVVRVQAGVHEAVTDVAAAEEPLEVRIDGEPFAVIMRTPGADADLSAGFLLSERVVTGPNDLGTIEHCRDAAPEDARNVINVTLMGESRGRLTALLDQRRQIVTSSSCGLCGRRTIESLRAAAPRVVAAWTIESAVLAEAPLRLRDRQTAFEETGGLHAAGLFTRQGDLELIAEDVGRHNAVDKVVGRMLLLERLPLDRSMLFVSGRASFEIVQKALFAGIPIVASVSAPSNLAVALAEDAGITLLGFVRGDRFNIYTHSARVSVRPS